MDQITMCKYVDDDALNRLDYLSCNDWNIFRFVIIIIFFNFKPFCQVSGSCLLQTGYFRNRIIKFEIYLFAVFEKILTNTKWIACLTDGKCQHKRKSISRFVIAIFITYFQSESKNAFNAIQKTKPPYGKRERECVTCAEE